MKTTFIKLAVISALGLFTFGSVMADVNTTFDAPPTMSANVAATPAGAYEATALTNLNASYVDFKLLVTANDLIPSELQQNPATATTGYNECIQIMVEIPKYLTASIAASNQAITQSAIDDKAASASGATQAQISLAKLEDVSAVDAQTTITDANEVQHRLGVVQIYQIAPPPATAQTPEEKLTLTYITAYEKASATDDTDANTLLVKARDAQDSYNSLLSQLPTQYKTAEWWVDAEAQTPSQNAAEVSLADVKIYNQSLTYIAADSTTLSQCSNDVTPYPLDAKKVLDLARTKLDDLKSSNGPAYQVPTDITNALNSININYQDTLTSQTGIATVITDVDKKPWPAGCPSHNITNA